MQEMQDTWVQSLGWKDPLEEEMAIHPSILAWKITWTEESGRLQSMGSQSWTWLSMQAYVPLILLFSLKPTKFNKNKKKRKFILICNFSIPLPTHSIHYKVLHCELVSLTNGTSLPSLLIFHENTIKGKQTISNDYVNTRKVSIGSKIVPARRKGKRKFTKE